MLIRIVIINFSIIILLSLFVFNILNFSPKFPFIHFSTQSQKTNSILSQEKNSPKTKPLLFINDSKKWSTQSIGTKNTKVIGNTKIEIGLTLTFTEKNSTPSGGYYFGNGLPENDKNSRALYLFYYVHPSRIKGEWILGYFSGGTKIYENILNRQESSLSEKFEITIPQGGKSAIVVSSKGEKTLNFPDSLYATTNNMTSAVKIPPYSYAVIIPFSINGVE